MKKLLAALWQDEQGQDLIEYGLLAALLSVLLVGAIVGVRTTLTTVFGNVQTALTNGSGS